MADTKSLEIVEKIADLCQQLTPSQHECSSLEWWRNRAKRFEQMLMDICDMLNKDQWNECSIHKKQQIIDRIHQAFSGDHEVEIIHFKQCPNCEARYFEENLLYCGHCGYHLIMLSEEKRGKTK